MNGQNLQLTKRELLGMIRSPSFWVGFVCVMIVLTISAPFDSGEEFTALQRAIYWSGIGVVTFFPAMAIIRSLSRVFIARGIPEFPASLLSGVVAGLPVGLTVFAVNSYIAGNDNGELKDAVRLVFMITPIAVAVAGLQHLILGQGVQAAASPPGSNLINRLSHSNRGKVLSLQAQDHYVEVTTTAGSELVLIRLADAIAELGDETGQQVHRSWWVARAAIADASRAENRTTLTLTDGRAVPVSRARAKAVQDWLSDLS